MNIRSFLNGCLCVKKYFFTHYQCVITVFRNTYAFLYAFVKPAILHVSKILYLLAESICMGSSILRMGKYFTMLSLLFCCFFLPIAILLPAHYRSVAKRLWLRQPHSQVVFPFAKQLLVMQYEKMKIKLNFWLKKRISTYWNWCFLFI